MSEQNQGGFAEPQMKKTICNMCSNHCGIVAYVRDGKIIRIEGAQEHPFHNLCMKPFAIPELVHSEKRLTDPLLKDNGQFVKITWDEAFHLMSDKLAEIQEKHGPEAAVIYMGNPTCIGPMLRSVVKRFADLYGTPNATSAGYHCFFARVMAYLITCGGILNADLSCAETKCILVWGRNAPESSASERDAIHSLIGSGAKLIVIDPRKTGLAKKANLTAQIRPGTDCALALGLIHVIVAEGLFDKAFVNDWTLGFEKLAEYVRAFPPERVEEITWVPAETIRTIARTYASTKPSCIAPGISLEHCSNGIQTMRALAILAAITGNIDIAGGNLIVPGLAYANFRLLDGIKQGITVGDHIPLYKKYFLEPSATSLTEVMLSEKPYPIKAMFVVGANPLVGWPNSLRVKKAFERLEFLVVEDLFMTETAQLASLVLPASSFLESEEIRDIYFNHEGIPLIAKSNKVIEPIGNTREDWKIWAELGRRMGYGEHFPWQDADQLMVDLLKPTSVTLDELKKHPGGLYYQERKYKKYLTGGFATSSGKVEIFSEMLTEMGYDPIPTFHEPVETFVGRPDLSKKYPLVLTTGARTGAYTHSRYRHLPSLSKRYPEPLLEIHSETATEFSIADGDLVRVESQRGSIEVKANLTHDIHPRVVNMLHGWSNASGANANCLTDNMAIDPISGFPEYRSLLCSVSKA
ncbi:MAG: molybdopterin-dependent oxidoreductase [Deltaproteobacteria bacterium]|nr:molybdopterin-dependent oxidoreductase [Deltaproteobacteria bacterium]